MVIKSIVHEKEVPASSPKAVALKKMLSIDIDCLPSRQMPICNTPLCYAPALQKIWTFGFPIFEF